MYNPFDHYFKKAKEQWYKARSAFKLEEIQDKFHLLDNKTVTVLDIWCAPWSWMQYTLTYLKKLWVKAPKIVGFDIRPVDLHMDGITTYLQDVTDKEKIKELLAKHDIIKADFIQSDMAPNTVGLKDIDAIRAFWLLEQTLWLYEDVLKEGGKFAIKVFMGPGFQEFVSHLKKVFWGTKIKVFKPKSCRSESKETYVIKI